MRYPGWMAPEMCEMGENDKVLDVSLEVDIFSLGLIFGVAFSKGNQHPFGKSNVKQHSRIMNKKSMILTIDDFGGNQMIFNLIESMLNIEPLKRPTVEQVFKALEDLSLLEEFERESTGLLERGINVNANLSFIEDISEDNLAEINKNRADDKIMDVSLLPAR